VNIDLTLPDQDALTGWMLELWRDQILEAERRKTPPRSCRTAPDQAWNDPDNKYAKLGSQLKALRAAGFIEVDCLYRNGLFGIYSGRRPSLSVERNIA
jgi:tRNA (cmo5U34)-methyltransferase